MRGGIINLIKPRGVSSAKALGAIKRRVYPAKIGHMGTLDPDASGVLPVCVGKATRLFDFFLAKRKRYRAEFTFGTATDTLDACGRVIETAPVNFTESLLQAALTSLTGEIEQVPPNYSAKNVGGVRAYSLARSGREFSLPAKKVTVYSFSLIDRISKDVYAFDIECGGGTFIRSLARDLAEKLGTVAHMSALVRTECGGLRIEDGVTAEEFVGSGDPEKYIIPIAEALSGVERLYVGSQDASRLLNGVAVDAGRTFGGAFAIFNGDKLLGLGRQADGYIKIGVNLCEE